MSSSPFDVTEHTSPCSYIRQYPHGVKHEDAVLHLAVKQYRPRHTPHTSTEPVTIIAAHGNGFPKECFEPLWADLNAFQSINIHSIWAADMANQGSSYALNNANLGDDPSWIDHSLDLFLMINTFRARMKGPLIGIGHSMGCAQLIYLASIHPRLFHSLILIDPVLQMSHPPGPNAALFSSMRRETWESRAKAESQIKRNGFFASMDSRCLDLFVKYALRDMPDGSVTLSTPKAQEAWTYVRSNMFDMNPDTAEGRRLERLISPELVPFSEPSRLTSVRPEMLPICEGLPHLRPRTLYLYGEYSHINFEEVREVQVASTGTGRGGNGGVEEGGVAQQELEDCGHLCVLEKPKAIASSVAEWLGKEVARWEQERHFWDKADTGKSKDNRTQLAEKWVQLVKADTDTERPSGDAKAKL
ncbi:Alpha/beta hydrolase family-domain-containing protein [Phaeosphaeria sp. MPI-PUGE-AT-0046c]|nr:Alpha/beta hydrolase family-domain-containing protein [Phaeosphaeria sp. MPI-PUGE-AT-0046c]